MVLGDERFFNIEGQEITRSVLVQKMIDYFNEKYPNAQITDFNEGSVIRNLLESVAVDIFHLEMNDLQILTAAFLSTSYGSYLDLHGEELNAPRYPATYGQGVLTFSIAEPAVTDVRIPAYTTILDIDTGMAFNTQSDAIIEIGDTSVDVFAISQVPGSITNAKAGNLIVFQDYNPYPDLTVTNNEAFRNGSDGESDDDYKARLIKIKGEDSFGSREYYIRLGESVAGVHDVILTTEAGYTAKVLVNGNEKPLDSDILADVSTKYTERNVVYNHTFIVEETGYTTVDLEFTAVVTDEVEESLFTDALTAYFDGGNYTIYGRTGNRDIIYNGVRINESITNYQLLSALESLPFVIQVTSLTSDEATFNKLEPDTDTVLKLGTVNITQQVPN